MSTNEAEAGGQGVVSSDGKFAIPSPRSPASPASPAIPAIPAIKDRWYTQDEESVSWSEGHGIHRPYWAKDVEEFKRRTEKFTPDKVTAFTAESMNDALAESTDAVRGRHNMTQTEQMECWLPYLRQIVVQAVDDLMLTGKQRSGWHKYTHKQKCDVARSMWLKGRTAFKTTNLEKVDKPPAASGATYEVLAEAIDCCLAWQPDDMVIERKNAVPSPMKAKAKHNVPALAQTRQAVEMYKDLLNDVMSRVTAARDCLKGGHNKEEVCTSLTGVAESIKDILAKNGADLELARCSLWETTSASACPTQDTVELIRTPLDHYCLYRATAMAINGKVVDVQAKDIDATDNEIRSLKHEIARLMIDNQGFASNGDVDECMKALTSSGSRCWANAHMVANVLHSRKLVARVHYLQNKSLSHLLPLGGDTSAGVIQLLFTGSHYDLLGVRQDGDKLKVSLDESDIETQAQIKTLVDKCRAETRSKAAKAATVPSQFTLECVDSRPEIQPVPFSRLTLKGLTGGPNKVKTKLRKMGIDTSGIEAIDKGKNCFLLTMRDHGSTQALILQVAGSDGLVVRKAKQKGQVSKALSKADTESEVMAMLKKMEIFMAEASKRTSVSKATDPSARKQQLSKAVEKVRECWHFKRGDCWHGDACWYSHGEPSNQPNQNHKKPHQMKPYHKPQTGVCFQYRDHGTCSYGEHCMFKHVGAAHAAQPGGQPALKHVGAALAPQPGGQAAAQRECFEFRARGRCKYGSACKFKHVGLTVHTGADPKGWQLPPVVPTQPPMHPHALQPAQSHAQQQYVHQPQQSPQGYHHHQQQSYSQYQVQPQQVYNVVRPQHALPVPQPRLTYTGNIYSVLQPGGQ